MISDFTAYLYSEKGLAATSIAAYQHDVELFLNHINKPLSELEEGDLLDYLNSLHNKKLASSTIARAIFACRVFFKFMIREKKAPSRLLLYLESPRVWQKIPEVLSYAEMEKMLQAPDIQCFTGCRDKAILEMLYATGLRVSELCSLNINDVDDSFLKVRGKGGKERVVPVGREALKALDDYLLRFRDGFGEEKALFITEKGQRIERIALWRWVKKYAESAGISKNISPHTFRHSYATHLLEGGADLRVIQELLGHATIASTERYTHLSQKQLQESFFALHPRN